MAIISLLESILLTRTIFQFYKTLSQDDSHTATPKAFEIFKNQLINYSNQIAKALFSPNFFIIILACYLGLAKVGHIKLFTDIIVLLYMLLNRSFGLPAAALFSSVAKQKVLDSSQDQASLSQITFIKVINWYIQFLYTLGIIISYIVTT